MRRPILNPQIPGPIAAQMIAEQERQLSPSSTRDYPLVVASGDGCWITDVDGNQFLDFSAGIAVCTTGHCHPHVVRAITEQSKKLIHMSGTDFYYGPQGELAQKLEEQISLTGGQRVFFTNSGTETVEAAIKLARYTTRRPHIIAFDGAFHGRSLGALSLTNSKVVQRRGFGPLLPEVSHIPYPGRAGVTVDDTFNDLEKLFKRRVDPSQVAAIFVEPIQGEGGYIIPPPSFLPRLRQVCDQHGILLVTDEVQSGMGRTGKFCAMEHWHVEPDIICLSKGIASGLPLGAMVARANLMQWPPGSHGSTFGGNPVACAAAVATMELLESGLLDHTAVMGKVLLEELREVMSGTPLMTEVRGLGLMAAIDLPDSATRNVLLHTCFHHGLILLGAGDRSIRLCPPLIVNEEEIHLMTEILADSLQEIGQRPAQAA
jgi:4-aminobutyrate aminotransferase